MDLATMTKRIPGRFRDDGTVSAGLHAALTGAYFRFATEPSGSNPLATMSTMPSTGSGKNSRSCLALSTFISPADCGAQRGSKLVCPPACPFYPFGVEAYDQWLKVDGNWMGKAVKFLVDRLGRVEVQQRVRRFTVPMRSPQVEVETALSNVLNFSLFVERQTDGRTLAEVWSATSAARDLNNDERVMLLHRQTTRPAVVEVQEVLDGKSLRCVDLLAPEHGEFVLFDRGAAAQLVRYSRMLTWVTHYPHFSRTNVFAMDLPHTVYGAWLGEIRQRAAGIAASRPGYSIKDYLAEHLTEGVKLVQALADQYRRNLFAGLDIRHCVASYLVKGGVAAIEAVLSGKPDFVAESAPNDSQFATPKAFFRWMQLGESAEFEKILMAKGGPRVDASVGDVGTLANVRLYPERLLVETFSQSKHEFARQKTAQYLDGLVTFETESIVDLAQMMEERRTRDRAVSEIESAVYGLGEAPPESYDDSDAADIEGDAPSAVPEEVRRCEIEEAHRRHYEKFMDEPVPALDGKSPRAAAVDPAMRPQLVELMKGHLHGLERRCREDRLQLDINWVLDALDLGCLKPRGR